MDDLFSEDEDDKSEKEGMENNTSSTESDINNSRGGFLLAQKGNDTSSDGKLILKTTTNFLQLMYHVIN